MAAEPLRSFDSFNVIIYLCSYNVASYTVNVTKEMVYFHFSSIYIYQVISKWIVYLLQHDHELSSFCQSMVRL